MAGFIKSGLAPVTWGLRAQPGSQGGLGRVLTLLRLLRQVTSYLGHSFLFSKMGIIRVSTA